MPEQPVAIKQRLTQFLDAVLEKSSINAAFRPIIRNVAVSGLGGADEAELRRTIEDLRDKVIPWLLEG